ncbi:MAG: DNA polymerase III subunit alpha, partial [Bacteroidetes bacterium]|nr:DNA polymerase III subunit alpha [Bacteroidota bacterium]
HLLLNKQVAKAERPKTLFVSEEPDFKFPKLEDSFLENAYDELELLGFPLCSPFDLIVDVAEECILSSELSANPGRVVYMLGYVVAVKDARTVHNDRMNFATFIDREGRFFDSTHFPQVVANFPFRGRGMYLLRGKVAEEFGYYSLETYSMKKIPFRARGY